MVSDDNGYYCGNYGVILLSVFATWVRFRVDVLSCGGVTSLIDFLWKFILMECGFFYRNRIMRNFGDWGLVRCAVVLICAILLMF